MVQHVSVRHETISLDSLDLHTEDSTRNHHTDLRVLLERELSVLRYLVADGRVVQVDVLDLISDLILNWTALKPESFVHSVEDREVVKCLGQDVDELVEPRLLFTFFLHDVGGQKAVFR